MKMFPHMGVSCDLGHLYKLSFPPIQGGSKLILASIGKAIFEKKNFENGGHIHVYSPGEGADIPVA